MSGIGINMFLSIDTIGSCLWLWIYFFIFKSLTPLRQIEGGVGLELIEVGVKGWIRTSTKSESIEGIPTPIELVPTPTK